MVFCEGCCSVVASAPDLPVLCCNAGRCTVKVVISLYTPCTTLNTTTASQPPDCTIAHKLAGKRRIDPHYLGAVQNTH